MTDDPALPLFPEGVAVVAGGSGGLGGAICKALARSGADVAILYRGNQNAAETVAAQAAGQGVTARCWRIDLADPEAVVTTLASITHDQGRIHTAVYAAGPAITINPLGRLKPDEFARVLLADAGGCFNFVHAVLPLMREGGGAVIGLTTNQLDRSEPRGALSSVPKAAVDKMFEVVAREEARFGIRAATVRAGWVDVGLGQDALSQQMPEPARQALLAGIPLKRMGLPWEIGEAVAFLASRRGGFITGAHLTVDGGQHL